MRKRNLLQGSTKSEVAAFAKIKAHRMQMATGSISAHRVYADEFFDLTRERRIALLEGDDPDMGKYLLSPAQNKKRTKELKENLKALQGKLGFIQITGEYQRVGRIEEETSFFVYALDSSHDLETTLKYLGHKYNQTAISYSAYGGAPHRLLCTSARSGGIVSEGRHYKFGDVMGRLEGEAWGEDGLFAIENYPRIRGRPFGWDWYKAKQYAESTLMAWHTKHESGIHSSGYKWHAKTYFTEEYFIYDRLLERWGLQ